MQRILKQNETLILCELLRQVSLQNKMTKRNEDHQYIIMFYASCYSVLIVIMMYSDIPCFYNLLHYKGVWNENQKIVLYSFNDNKHIIFL